MFETRPSASLRALLTGLIDYAGLFPPAGLDMYTSVRNYLDYRAGEHAWMLGRFVVPAVRLPEMLNQAEGQRFPLTVLIGSNIDADLSAAHRADADSIEMRWEQASQLPDQPRFGSVFVEISDFSSPDDVFSSLAKTGRRAKIRTGGATANATPSSTALMEFLAACARSSVAFKATAGLHHPLRSASGHGFLNLFLTAALICAGKTAFNPIELLEDRDAADFCFEDEGASWRGCRISTESIRRMRGEFALSFGSCSFDEPIEGLKELNLL